MARFFFQHKNCTVQKRGGFAVEVPPYVQQFPGGAEREDRWETERVATRAAQVQCPACGAQYKARTNYGPPEPGTYRPRFMGRVEGARLTRMESRTPCDGRCIGAVGPSCDCSCGGENHGMTRLVDVAVDAGSVKSALD
jgi:hypothetical protein